MVRTNTSDGKIYSVDMMIAHININKPKNVSLLVTSLIDNLEHECWGIPGNSNYSPMSVLKNPKLKKHKEEMKRIDAADLSYPIIIHNGVIIDGMHRLAKAHKSNMKKIKAHIFDNNLMAKFFICKAKDRDKMRKLQVFDYIKMYNDRF